VRREGKEEERQEKENQIISKEEFWLRGRPVSGRKGELNRKGKKKAPGRFLSERYLVAKDKKGGKRRRKKKKRDMALVEKWLGPKSSP